MGIRSYRSTFNSEPSLNLPAERTMSTFTMGENVFVLLDDPISPGRYDLQTLSLATKPTHLKSTYITLSPPGALEQLLSHLRARWGSVRGQTAGPQLTIDGRILSIGTDWIVRVGNVIMSTGSVKGILLEVIFSSRRSLSRVHMVIQAEYLPLPTVTVLLGDNTSEMVTNLLTSVLPQMPGAKTLAVTVSDFEWAEVIFYEKEEGENDEKKQEVEDDIWASGEDEEPVYKPGDWVGVERDRRSAYLIIGALRSEGII